MLIWGAIPLVLKVAAVLPDTLALIFCYRVLRREAGQPSALLGCLLLAVSPLLVMTISNPGEFSTLGSLFFFLSLDLLSLVCQHSLLSLLAGLA